MTDTMQPEDVPGTLAAIVGQALYDSHGNTCPQPGCDGHPGQAACETWARDLLAAVLPEHERQVRAKVADEIEAEYRRREQDGLAIGPLLHAADIARGQA